MATDLENFPVSKAANRMLSYVTRGWYDKSYVGKWTFEVMGREIDQIKAIIDALPEEMHYQTATWALKYHEIKYGLPVLEDLPYEQRRALIRQKKLENQAPMSPWRMEEILKAYTGANNCEIHDCNDEGWEDYFTHPNIFIVQVDSDAAVDVSALKKRLDSVKQSHTVYELEFTSDVGILLTVGQTPWQMKFRICGTYPGVSTGLALADSEINLAESDNAIEMAFIPSGILNAGSEPVLSTGLSSADQGTALSATEEIYSVDVPYCGEEGY